MRPLRNISDADLRLWAGFSLFAAWLALMPRAALANSTVVHASTLALGAGFAVLLVALGAAEALRAGRGERAVLALCSVAAAGGGFAFLALSNPAARLACMALQMAAGIGLLLHWGRVLCACPLRLLFACAAGGLACTALTHLAVALAGAGAGTLGNAHVFTDMMLGILALLPLASGALGWKDAGVRATAGAGAGAGAAAGAGKDARGGADARAFAGSDGEKVPLPLSYVLIFCLASALTGFMAGFTYLPHQFNWNLMACLRSVIVLAAAAAFGLYLARQRAVAISHVNGFLLFSLMLTIGGLLLLTVNATAAAFAARSLLDAALDCYFAIGIVLFCGLAHEYRLPFFPAFAAGMLGSGLFWSYEMGVYAKRLLGYDLNILAPLCTAAIAVLAVAFFLSFVSGPGGARGAGAGAAAAVGAASGAGAPGTVAVAAAGVVAAAGAGTGSEAGAAALREQAVPQPDVQVAAKAAPAAQAEAVPRPAPQARPVPRPAPQARPVPRPGPQAETLDAASAHEVLVRSHEEALAPYGLSQREMQVSLMALDGLTAPVAAEELGITVATVKFHLGNAYRKLGVHSKAELFRLARHSNADAPDKEASHAE